MKGRYFIYTPVESARDEKRFDSTWRKFVAVCRSLHADGLSYSVELNLTALRVAGTIIWTKMRQEYLNSEVRECSSSPDESCGGGHGVLPFGTSSL